MKLRAVQWLALPAHSNKATGSNPGQRLPAFSSSTETLNRTKQYRRRNDCILIVCLKGLFFNKEAIFTGSFYVSPAGLCVTASCLRLLIRRFRLVAVQVCAAC